MYRFEHANRVPQIIIRNSFCAQALVWSSGVIAMAGPSMSIIFYDEEGVEEASFDNGSEQTYYKAACTNSTGEAIVFGGRDCFFVYSRSRQNLQWELDRSYRVENMKSVTALAWKQDGSLVALGTLGGVVDVYNVAIYAPMVSCGYEITYVSHSQLLVRKEEDQSHRPVVLNSRRGLDIVDITIHEDRYMTGHTDETLLISDLTSGCVSEIDWNSSGDHQEVGFNFDDESAVIIHYASELFVVEYGSNDILDSIRTCKISTDVISLRLNQVGKIPGPSSSNEKKMMAYLLDDQCICIKDLVSYSQVTLSHDCTIDWLELNPRGDLLLFRDIQLQLYVFFTVSQTRKQLSNYCSYAQWVPDTDVIVAQSLDKLRVWYNVRGSDQSTSVVINGDIQDIERKDGKTEIIVDEGLNEAVYPLDESLLEFTTLVFNKQFIPAMMILENIELSLECEDMWKYLGTAALEANEIAVSQRCAAAVGDMASDAYLGGILDIQRELHISQGCDSSIEHYAVRNKLALFNKDVQAAEEELLNHGKIDECIDMYLSLQRNDSAIRVAKTNNRLNRADEIGDQYIQNLLDTGQSLHAATLKEQMGEFEDAINLYLKASAPNRASKIIVDQDIRQPIELVKAVAFSLTKAGMYDRAGIIYERLSEFQKALDSFIKGKDFRKAIDLARRSFPDRVVELQEKWADHLASQKQIDMAINHYIEANLPDKAIELALNQKHYARALQLVNNMDGGKGSISSHQQHYYCQLGDHFASSEDKLDIASRCYVSAGQPELAVNMYMKRGDYELAERLAKTHMDRRLYESMYREQAKILEKEGNFHGAEALLLSAKEYKLAIDMCRRGHRFPELLRLIAQHYPDELKETNLFVAKYQESMGCLSDAELHYVEASEALLAVEMYTTAFRWDDALRCAVAFCGHDVVQKLALKLILNVGVPGALKLIEKKIPSFLDGIINRSMDEKMFDLAYQIVDLNCPKKLPDVYFKHALHYKDLEQFEAAEKKFIQADRASEAVDMYINSDDWSNAMRVATEHFHSRSSIVFKVMIGQANFIIKSGGDLEKAEAIFIGATQPDLAIDMYLDAAQWKDAQRVATFYLPQRLNEVIKASTLQKERSSISNGEKKYSAEVGSLSVVRKRGENDERNEGKSSGYDDSILQSLEQFANDSEWDQLWKTSEANKDLVPKAVIGRYALMNADELIDRKGVALDDAVKLLQRYSGHYNEMALAMPIHRRLVKCLMMRSQGLECADGVDHRDAIASLRDVLYQLATKVKTTEMEELLLATHYQHVFYLAESLGCKDIAAKCAVTLLKYPSIIPQDRAFYQAGMIAMEMDLTSVAFVLLNRYVDIAEAIDTGDVSGIDNHDFHEADAIPLNDAAIPTSHYVTDEKDREACRSWVLSVITDSSVDQVIPQREKCHKTLFEGFFRIDRPTCIVTGFPVYPADKLEVNGAVANRKDWNSIVSKTNTCPWSGLRNQRPMN